MRTVDENRIHLHFFELLGLRKDPSLCQLGCIGSKVFIRAVLDNIRCRPFFMPFNCVASSQVKDSASQNRDRTRQSKQASLKTATGPDADRATRPKSKAYQGVAVTDKQVLCDKWWYSTGLLATYCS